MITQRKDLHVAIPEFFVVAMKDCRSIARKAKFKPDELKALG
jgi:hypothetical protein